jgi:hypothetical protein
MKFWIESVLLLLLVAYVFSFIIRLASAITYKKSNIKMFEAWIVALLSAVFYAVYNF